MPLLPHISDADLVMHLREYEANGNKIRVGDDVRIWLGTDRQKQLNVRVTPQVFALLRRDSPKDARG